MDAAKAFCGACPSNRLALYLANHSSCGLTDASLAARHAEDFATIRRRERLVRPNSYEKNPVVTRDVG